MASDKTPSSNSLPPFQMSTFLQAAQHRYEHAQAPQKFDIWQRVQALSSNAMRELHDFHDAMRRKVPALRCAECVSQALSAAEPRAAQLALQELPGINLSMVWSILWSIGKDIALYVGGGAALGGVVGGAAGAFAGFGAGAVPGAMVGASAGAEVGSWILGAIGIKCLIEYIGKAIPDMTHQFSKGFAHAWRAGELDPSRTMDIATEMHSATDAFAHGQLQLVIAILAAIVLYLSKGQLGKTRLFSELGKSKLGSQFASWVEANMDALMKHPKLRPVKKAAASETPKPSPAPAKQVSKPTQEPPNYNKQMTTDAAVTEGAAENVKFDQGIADHLTKFDGFSQKTGISGTHNLDEFMQAATQHNVKILSQTQGSADGIINIEYQIPALDRAGNIVVDEAGATVYKSQVLLKTVYDPSVISDETIVDLGQQAAKSGYQKAISSGAQAYNAESGGIQFRVYLDPKTGNVTNYHPR